MLNILHVKITVGFGHTQYPQYYKKGEGKSLGDAIQAMLENRHTNVNEEEFDLLLQIGNSIEVLEPSKIATLKKENPHQTHKEGTFQMTTIMHYGVQTPVQAPKTQPDPLQTPKNGILKPVLGRPKRTDDERASLNDRELAREYQRTQPAYIEERRDEGDIL